MPVSVVPLLLVLGLQAPPQTSAHNAMDTEANRAQPTLRVGLQSLAHHLQYTAQRSGSCDPLDPWDVLRGVEGALWGLWSMVVGVVSLMGFTLVSGAAGLMILLVVVLVLALVYGLR